MPKYAFDSVKKTTDSTLADGSATPADIENTPQNLDKMATVSGLVEQSPDISEFSSKFGNANCKTFDDQELNKENLNKPKLELVLNQITITPKPKPIQDKPKSTESDCEENLNYTNAIDASDIKLEMEEPNSSVPLSKFKSNPEPQDNV